MKPLLFSLLFLAACKSSAVFVTPNDVKNTKVTLLNLDSTKTVGEITVGLERYNGTYVRDDDKVQFKPEGSKTTQTISIYTIIGYWYDTSFYAAKKVDIQLNEAYRFMFVKRLTEEHSKIQLYQLYESGRGNGLGQAKYSYYISLPKYGQYQAANTSGKTLLPDFEYKMSKIVRDCPELVQKIEEKKAGYFIPQFSFNGNLHPDVLLRIINEYNNCKP